MTEASDVQINSSPDFAAIDEAVREAMREEVLSHAKGGRSRHFGTVVSSGSRPRKS
ncbi:MAG: hypothetical protein U0941_12240 [Planctomycetaceae bacterium]